jgi:hypothetical protein
MSIYDWEFWMVAYLVFIVLFLVVFSRLSKVNQRLDELMEGELHNPVVDERKYDQSDFQEELRGEK